MKKYIIIVSVYDQENTQAYPLGGIFDYHAAAEKYIADHWREVKNDHWAKDRVDGEDRYSEELTDTGWHAEDWSDGASIEITIHEVPVISQQVPCAFVDMDDLENRGWDASNLSDEDMESIASKMEDYILDEVDYWTAMKTACEDMDVPRKDYDDAPELFPGTLGMLNELSIRE
jgi:hypothetical protein